MWIQTKKYNSSSPQYVWNKLETQQFLTLSEDSTHSYSYPQKEIEEHWAAKEVATQQGSR